MHTIFDFSAEIANVADWVAERSHFELSGDFPCRVGPPTESRKKKGRACKHPTLSALGLRPVFFRGSRADLVSTDSVFVAFANFARSILLILLQPYRLASDVCSVALTKRAVEGDRKANAV
jgi:hypothetical protein